MQSYTKTAQPQSTTPAFYSFLGKEGRAGGRGNGARDCYRSSSTDNGAGTVPGTVQAHGRLGLLAGGDEGAGGGDVAGVVDVDNLGEGAGAKA